MAETWEQRMAERHKPPAPEPRKPPETLVEFLTLVLGEEEYLAENADRWGRESGHYDTGWAVANPMVGFHLHHGPRQHLLDIEAKRRIVALHGDGHDDGHECPSEPEGGSIATGYYDADCPTLRALALSYADHPDYRNEWRP